MRTVSALSRPAAVSRFSRRAALRAGLLSSGSITAAGLLAACGGSSSSSSSRATPASGQGSTQTGASEQPQKGGTLRMGLSRFPENLDPHLAGDFRSQRFTEQLYAGLVKFSPKMEFEPDLAAAWEWSDETTLKLTLRDNLAFHDGTPLTAEDVKFTIERINAADFPALAKPAFRSVGSVEAVDAKTARIKLKAPNAAFLDGLPIATAGIVSKKFTEGKGNKLDQTANGAGPFALKDWATGVNLRMERNARFHEADLPRLDALLYTPVVDENARAAALRAGDVDIIDYVPFQEFARFKQGPKTMLAEGIEYGKWRSVRLNNSVAPLNDPRVRQALNWAVDRTRAAEIIVAEFGGPWTEMNALPKDNWAHTSDGLTQFAKPDLDKAKQLLTAAGFANGFKMSLKIFKGSNWPVQLSQVVQADWRKIGVEVTIDSLENTVWSSDFAAGKWEMTTTGGGITGSDPDYLYSQFHSSSTARTDRFADAQVDQLLDTGRTTLDQAKRKQIYADVQKRISELAPWVIVFRADDREALSTRLRGFTHMPNYQMVTLRGAWLAP